MFARRKKATDLVSADVLKVYEILSSLCQEGTCARDAFVLDDYQLTLYADVEKLNEQMVSITFQLHHTWFIDPIVETVIGSSDEYNKAIEHACQKFYIHVLKMILHALKNTDGEQVEGFSDHTIKFHMYQSKMIYLGSKEGNDDSFWTLYKEDIMKRLGNKKAYWISCFAYRDAKSAVAEVLMNGQLANSLSVKVAKDTLDWELLQSKHTEKQFILLIQDDATYKDTNIRKDAIINCCKQAMLAFDECQDKSTYFKIRKDLVRSCPNESIAYEIFSLIPELYCKYYYKDVTYKEILTMVNKETTESYYQSQLFSYYYIEEAVQEHYQTLSEEQIKRVLAFSVNAKTIAARLAQQEDEKDIVIDQICYYANEQYELY